MSLNFNFEKVANCDEVCMVERTKENGEKYKAMNPVTECLIWATMAVGMDKITEKNWKEFYTRVKMVEACSGCYLQGSDEGTGEIIDMPFTVQQIKDHIGLYTNASRYPKTKFLSNMYRRIEDRSNRDIRSYNEKNKPAMTNPPRKEHRKGIGSL